VSSAATANGTSLRSSSRARTVLRTAGTLPLGVKIGGLVVAIFALAAIFAPLVAPYGPDQLDLNAIFAAPSSAHWFGTDDTGRDVFSRTLYGLRLDLALALLVTYIPLPLGALAGAVAGFFGGWADTIISRIADVMISFPFIVLIIAIVAIIGPGVEAFLIGVPLAAWALYARLARSRMLVLREQPFMLATAALGYSRRRALFRHAFPNVLRPCLVYSTVDLIGNLLLLAGLSYLGVGIQPPTADLGSIISSGQPYLLTAWWITTLPGLTLVAFGVGVGLVGEGLADRSSEWSAQ